MRIQRTYESRTTFVFWQSVCRKNVGQLIDDFEIGDAQMMILLIGEPLLVIFLETFAVPWPTFLRGANRNTESGYPLA
jgi:hypothetical protein